MKSIRGSLILLVTCSLSLTACKEPRKEFAQTNTPPSYKTYYDLGRFETNIVATLITPQLSFTNVRNRVAWVSSAFLGIPYVANTMIGKSDAPEGLAVNLRELDCMTYLDCVLAALTLADEGVPEGATNGAWRFAHALRMIRYAEGRVTYTNRNHFFYDWIHMNACVRDVTREVSDAYTTRRIRLNERANGSNRIEGVPVREVTIAYVPKARVHTAMLETGDFVGLVPPLSMEKYHGYDVTHLGIVIRKGTRVFLRHAKYKKRILDEDLYRYLSRVTREGIIVARYLPLP